MTMDDPYRSPPGPRPPRSFINGVCNKVNLLWEIQLPWRHQVHLDKKHLVWGILAPWTFIPEQIRGAQIEVKVNGSPRLQLPFRFAHDAYNRRKTHGQVERLALELHFNPGDSVSIDLVGAASVVIDLDLYGESTLSIYP
jgi:hypothetical protein